MVATSTYKCMPSGAVHMLGIVLKWKPLLT